MDRDDLDQLLSELRTAGTDHGSVEAKRARTGLPTTTWQSLSAFANTDGGIVLLGVHENGGSFDVTGVEDAAAVTQALQAACAELEPALRPRISIVDHEGASVIVAELAPLPRSARPCHRRGQSPHGSSYTRVGDADQVMTSVEVDAELATRSPNDHSRRPAPDHASLDAAAVSGFCSRVRRLSTRNAEMADDAILRTWGVTSDGHPTLAGVLALGEAPAAVTASARVAYRRLPRAGDPAGTRYASTHLEGTVGELLDAALTRLREDLNTVQVDRDGNLINELDVPTVALRELIGNALLHRSFTDSQEATSAALEVSDRAVVITSPGGLHVGADTALLGLAPISGVRNLTLVRICEQLDTPAGARIVENQASGIAAADEQCRRLGTMPPLFVDRPATFEVILLRGGLDAAAAQRALDARNVSQTPEVIRLVSVAQGLERALEETAMSELRRVVFDARLAARALAPCTVEDGAAVLRELEDAGVIERRHTRYSTYWALRRPDDARAPARDQADLPTGKRHDRIPDLVRAIAESSRRQLSSSELASVLNLRSTRSVSRWINRAADAGLIEATTDSAYDPSRAYRLTQAGRALAGRRG